MDTAIWVALISSIGVTLIVKFVEIKWLPKTKQEDVATTIRQELREEIARCKLDVSIKEKEVGFWKVTYFQLIELLYKNHIDVPEEFLKPYRDDPSTPNIPGE